MTVLRDFSGFARAACSAVLAASLVLAAGLMPVRAEEAAPKNIVVGGDSLGDGLYIGFYRLLRKNTDYTVEKRSKVSTGLSRPDFYDWVAEAKTLVKETSPDHIVFVVGGNDVQALRHDEKWVKRGSPDWEKIYRTRIESVMKTFVDSGAHVYWAGMPVIRSTKLNDGVQGLNKLYKEYADATEGVDFISLFDITADEDGNFQSHYKDSAGRQRQMRTNDGVHFTVHGYIHLAEHIMASIEAKEKGTVQLTEGAPAKAQSAQDAPKVTGAN